MESVNKVNELLMKRLSPIYNTIEPIEKNIEKIKLEIPKISKMTDPIETMKRITDMQPIMAGLGEFLGLIQEHADELNALYSFSSVSTAFVTNQSITRGEIYGTPLLAFQMNMEKYKERNKIFRITGIRDEIFDIGKQLNKLRDKGEDLANQMGYFQRIVEGNEGNTRTY